MRHGGRKISLQKRGSRLSPSKREAPPVSKIILEGRIAINDFVGDYRCDKVSTAVGLFVETQGRSVGNLTHSDEKSAGLPPAYHTCRCIID